MTPRAAPRRVGAFTAIARRDRARAARRDDDSRRARDAPARGVRARSRAPTSSQLARARRSCRRGPRVIVANHVSYLDPIAIARGAAVRPIAKGEVAGWPIVGAAARELGVIFVERDDPWSRVARAAPCARGAARRRAGAELPRGHDHRRHAAAAVPARHASASRASPACRSCPVALRCAPALAWYGDATFCRTTCAPARPRALEIALAIGAPIDPRGPRAGRGDRRARPSPDRAHAARPLEVPCSSHPPSSICATARPRSSGCRRRVTWRTPTRRARRAARRRHDVSARRAVRAVSRAPHESRSSRAITRSTASTCSRAALRRRRQRRVPAVRSRGDARGGRSRDRADRDAPARRRSSSAAITRSPRRSCARWRRAHGPLAVVHVDAHLDTSGPETWGDDAPPRHADPPRARRAAGSRPARSRRSASAARGAAPTTSRPRAPPRRADREPRRRRRRAALPRSCRELRERFGDAPALRHDRRRRARSGVRARHRHAGARRPDLARGARPRARARRARRRRHGRRRDRAARSTTPTSPVTSARTCCSRASRCWRCARDRRDVRRRAVGHRPRRADRVFRAVRA